MDKFIIRSASLNEVLRDELCEALRQESLQASELAEFYLVNLLNDFHNSKRSFEKLFDRDFERPLALEYLEAIEDSNPSNKSKRLKRLGDQILIVSGFFGERLHKTLVRLPYYIAIGGRAYGYLSVLCRSDVNFCDLYSELAMKFAGLVKAISLVAPWNRTALSNSDIVHAYERWLSNGDESLKALLEEKGIRTAA